MENYIRDVLKPKIQADGGEIDFLDISDNTLTLQLSGECAVCSVADKCLNQWLADEIKRDLKLDVKVKFIKKPPYFRDI